MGTSPLLWKSIEPGSQNPFDPRRNPSAYDDFEMIRVLRSVRRRRRSVVLNALVHIDAGSADRPREWFPAPKAYVVGSSTASTYYALTA